MSTLTTHYKEAQSETRLQTALENYFHLLRERVPAMVEMKGALPAHFWEQEQKALAKGLASVGLAEPRSQEWAERVVSSSASRVNELLAMESNQEISLEMLRYELRIGALSDARAERLALQQARNTGKTGVF